MTFSGVSDEILKGFYSSNLVILYEQIQVSLTRRFMNPQIKICALTITNNYAYNT